MTNQEAMELAIKACEKTWNEKTCKQIRDALEQEPCGDAVSRQVVLNTLDRMDKALDTDRTVESYKELLTECYKVLPSITPQESITDRVEYGIDGNLYRLTISNGKELKQDEMTELQKAYNKGFDDCRQAALDVFGLSEKSRKYGGDHSGYDTMMKYEIQDILESLPPVKPQPICEEREKGECPYYAG